MRKFVALISLLAILAFVNWSIAVKERHLAEGQTVYLALAPVDPRSLMQGDYMALRFRLADAIRAALPKAEDAPTGRRRVRAADGFAVVGLDERNVGTFRRIHTGERLSADEILMRYRVRLGTVKLATNAYFFQEGHAEAYEPARYGEFRVDENGELLLVAMHDETLNRLGPKTVAPQ